MPCMFPSLFVNSSRNRKEIDRETNVVAFEARGGANQRRKEARLLADVWVIVKRKNKENPAMNRINS